MKKVALMLGFSGLLACIVGCGDSGGKKDGGDASSDANPSDAKDGSSTDLGTDVRVDAATDVTPATDGPQTDSPAARFTVGGTITGLRGTGLVLQNNGGDSLTVPAEATSFTFATSLATGSPFAITVLVQPGAPTQTCTVASGTGTVGTGAATGTAITCSTATFTVGGTISGLTGTGLVLKNNGGSDLTVAANATTFTFATPVASGAAYLVTVSAQPGTPTQTCTVASGTGTVGAGNVTNVSITCAVRAFTVGGTVSGLTGAGLVVRNNGGDNVTIPANATTFTFPTAVPSARPYLATVLIQPSGPTQTCTIANGAGTVGAANVTNIAITCSTQAFTVGGTISGLTGTGMVLQNNAGNNLTVAAGATTFAFASPVASGAPFAVTVLTQPGSPAQSCSVSGGAGTVGSANVTSVVVNCTVNSFTVGGTVTGLLGTLVLRNGTENQTLTSDGMFAFQTPVASGATYAVSVFTQPTAPSQTCVVTNGGGTIASANVTNITVACTTNTFTVRATVAGLAGTGMTINNGADVVPVTMNGTVAFPTVVASGRSFWVTVVNQPTSLSQSCSVTTGGSGIIGNTDVTAAIVCVTNTYNVRATVTGLAGTGLVLHNGADNVPIAADTTFNFPTRVPSGGGYQVTVNPQPTNQTCVVTPAAPGVVTNMDVAVAVVCTNNGFTIGGTVSGLAGTLVLHNGTENLSVMTSGGYTFVNRVLTGQPYSVSVQTQPAARVCSVLTPTNMGIVAAANVTNVDVLCCTTGNHVCGSACSSNMNVASCGATSCTACPVPPNSVATCNGTACGSTCAAGFGDCTAAAGCETSFSSMGNCGGCGLNPPEICNGADDNCSGVADD
ncbi:MAG: hypothetical protein ABUR63_06495, partial [Verrucomicrobiota bacterium]